MRWHLPPLVARELLAYSRQPWTYWLRLLTALAAVSVLAVMAATGKNRLGKTDGFSLFAGSTAILFFIASLNGLRSTSDSIASERRQGTLVLLILADLELNTILVSKLVTNSMRNAWAFLGTLPVLGLCLLLGGVSGLAFVQGVLAIVAAAGLSLMVGLEQSCRNQSEHEAFSHGLRQLLMLNFLPLVSPSGLVLSAFLTDIPFWKVYFWATLPGTVFAACLKWWVAKAALANNWQEPPPEEGRSNPAHRHDRRR
jgi:ABC-type transport system involved in cytochrome c biogenesis permease component